MIRTRHSFCSRPARSPVAVLAFLLGFVVLLVMVSHYYLIPALIAFKNADPASRKVMSAHALLIMTLLLFILLMGLVITFRIGRFFRPRATTPTKPTVYVDAWKESGRRLVVPKDEDEKDDGEA